MRDPHVLARNMIVEVEDADGFRVAGNPIKFSDTPDPRRRGPVPDLDSAREQILRELGIETS